MAEQDRKGLESEAEVTLTELALNLRNSWNHSSDVLWSKIEPELWALTHNPWVVLQAVSRTRLRTLLSDKDFHEQVRKLVEQRRESLERQSWFERVHPNAGLTCVAYFSMEFGLSEALPIAQQAIAIPSKQYQRARFVPPSPSERLADSLGTSSQPWHNHGSKPQIVPL